MRPSLKCASHYNEEDLKKVRSLLKSVMRSFNEGTVRNRLKAVIRCRSLESLGRDIHPQKKLSRNRLVNKFHHRFPKSMNQPIVTKTRKLYRSLRHQTTSRKTNSLQSQHPPMSTASQKRTRRKKSPPNEQNPKRVGDKALARKATKARKSVNRNARRKSLITNWQILNEERNMNDRKKRRPRNHRMSRSLGKVCMSHTTGRHLCPNRF
jgi:hypothetical protein